MQHSGPPNIGILKFVVVFLGRVPSFWLKAVFWIPGIIYAGNITNNYRQSLTGYTLQLCSLYKHSTTMPKVVYRMCATMRLSIPLTQACLCTLYLVSSPSENRRLTIWHACVCVCVCVCVWVSTYCTGDEIKLHLFLTWAPDKHQWSTAHSSSFSPREEPQIHWIWGWVGPRGGQDIF